MDHHLFHGTSASYWIRYEKDPSGEVLATAAGPNGSGWLGTVATARGPTREQAERLLLEKLLCLDA